MLAPGVKTGQVMKLPYGSYHYALNGDGTCCRFVLVDPSAFQSALFGIIVHAIIAGDITTKSMATFLFPNTYLPLPNGGCCELGFHSYVFQPADPSTGNVEKRWIFNYSSWITPGPLFGPFAADITVLNHEIAESYNDPFVASDGVHNVTPWWPNPFTLCQEVADVVELLPHEIYPITMNGMTYHPQNVALLQWFEGKQSDAIDGAFSYPDESVLTSPLIAQKPSCHP
jgi:hypothetical protein